MSRKSDYSTDVYENFKYAVDQIRNSKSNKNNGPTNDEKLQFYSLYKQATVGKCNVPKPWPTQIVEYAKWNAWFNLGDMTKENAMLSYCDLFIKVSDKYNQL